ncbi:hypothetical protein ACHHYP_04738 [Achlya hypogyna]|uniref:F-box domain-containing protein n=1 Tax=Achlya hypogyna TaxID=1202772 RepID=A0A1V9Z099_ACHHY|nr:hypothetical protein ACHHYP_04738 [Achlya hypogyna]
MDGEPLTSLPQDVLVRALGFLDSHGLCAFTATSRFSRDLIASRDELWKGVFCRQWSVANFYLPESTPLELSPFLAAKYPRPSDAYHFLCQAMRPVPSSMDVDFIHDFDDAYDDFAIADLTAPDGAQRYALAHLANPGETEGRSVRANQPVDSDPIVVVHCTGPGKSFRVDLVLTMYFEMYIETEFVESQPIEAPSDFELFSIGFAQEDVGMIENHAGSFGYHGKEGTYFSGTEEPFALETFGPGDTVGCGISYKYVPNEEPFLFFTKNGRRFDNSVAIYADRCVFPVFGTNTMYPVRPNFGASPFRYDPYTQDVDDEEREYAHSTAPLSYDNYLSPWLADTDHPAWRPDVHFPTHHYPCFDNDDVVDFYTEHHFDAQIGGYAHHDNRCGDYGYDGYDGYDDYDGYDGYDHYDDYDDYDGEDYGGDHGLIYWNHDVIDDVDCDAVAQRRGVRPQAPAAPVQSSRPVAGPGGISEPQAADGDPTVALLEEAMSDLLAEMYDSDEELRRKYDVVDDPRKDVD